MNKSVRKVLLPSLIVFIIVNELCLFDSAWLDKKNINHSVLLLANCLLFLLSLITFFMHIKTLQNSNAYSFARSVTLGSFIKLIVIAVAVLIYLLKAGNNRSIYAIAAAMILYIVYTIIEVRAAMQLNKNRNA